MESYSKLKAEPNESDVKQSNLAEQLGWVCPKSFSPKIDIMKFYEDIIGP